MLENLKSLVARRAHPDSPKHKSWEWTMWLESASREIPIGCNTPQACEDTAAWLMKRATIIPENAEFVRAHRLVARFVLQHAARLKHKTESAL